MILWCGVAQAEDSLTYQIRFRKLVFQCQDGTEEVVDASVKGGNTYEHTCKDGKWTNKFVNYDGLIQLNPTEYETTDSKELIAMKEAKVNEWIEQKNNHPAYIEPTKEELEEYRYSLIQQVDEVETKLVEKITVEEVAEMKAEYETKVDVLTSAETIKTAEPIKEISK